MTCCAQVYADIMDATMVHGTNGQLDGFKGPTGPRRLTAGYGRFVGFMKLLLSTVAVVLIAMVIAWPQLNEQDGRFRISPVKISPEDAENYRMLNARYTGVDDKNRPYAITADSADRKSADSKIIKLNTPKADILLSSQSWIALTAANGIYDQESQILELVGEVNLFHDSGYEFHTTNAVLDLMAGDAMGLEQVSGQGPFGHLKAAGFRIINQGERVELVGQSAITIYSNYGDKN